MADVMMPLHGDMKQLIMMYKHLVLSCRAGHRQRHLNNEICFALHQSVSNLDSGNAQASLLMASEYELILKY